MTYFAFVKAVGVKGWLNVVKPSPLFLIFGVILFASGLSQSLFMAFYALALWLMYGLFLTAMASTIAHRKYNLELLRKQKGLI